MLARRAVWDDPLAANRDFLRSFVAEQAVQTNEVQRSWILLPLFLQIAQRTGAEMLDLIELGSSAGLNLVWDRYQYRYEAGEWGPENGPLELEGQERRAIPAELLEPKPQVRGRIGIDLAPIDVTLEEEARLLRCFVWADQNERLERLDRAIEAVRAEPPNVIRGNFVDVLPDVLASQPLDGVTVVFQTAALDYLADEGRARVRAALEEAGPSRAMVFVSAGQPRIEESCWGLRLVYWPGGEREFAGHADVHGRWLQWEL